MGFFTNSFIVKLLFKTSDLFRTLRTTAKITRYGVARKTMSSGM